MNGDYVECTTQAQLNALAPGDIAILHNGRFEARGSAHVEAWDSAHVEAWGSAHVEARGSVHVEARDSAHVEARDSVHVEATAYVSVTRHGSGADVRGGVLIQVPDLLDLAAWLDYYGVEHGDGSAVVYKAVDEDFRSSHGGKYQPGASPEAPDWRPDHDCGGGLHFSATPRMAQRYYTAATRYLACRVPRSETVVVGSSTSADKIKSRACWVLYEVTLDGERIAESVSA